jgi:hypothetical protein
MPRRACLTCPVIVVEGLLAKISFRATGNNAPEIADKR